MDTNAQGLKKSVEDYLNEVDYGFEGYIPSNASLHFINFIKLVNGGTGETNKSPVTHFQLMDNIFSKKSRLAVLCHRGFAKSTLLTTYLPLYIAVFGKLDNFGVVNYMLAVLDSQEGGAKTMRKSIEMTYNNSEFLQKYIVDTRFTDAFIELENTEGHRLGIKMVGAQMSIRGTRFSNRNGSHRPEFCIMDDILSDTDAKSPTVIANIENTIHKAVDKAMHPTRNKICYIGTVFSHSDPLYKVIGSGRWSPSVYPVCEKYPCTREEFKGSWEDRFPYEVVKRMHEDAVSMGRMSDFNGEMMNRVMSDEDRLIQDSDIMWYPRANVIQNKGLFNFYITTDFATSEKTSADFSTLFVWAYNNVGDWFWVDGICKRQLMDKNVDDLFRLAQEYKQTLQQVGVEVTGQQGGFIPWIKQEMMLRNIYFTLASENNGNKEGIRPVTNKLQRFNVVVPWFKLKRMYFPEEMRNDPIMVEIMDELSLASMSGIKSRHDDCGSFDMLVDTPNGKVKLGLINNDDSVITYRHDHHLIKKLKDHKMTGVKELYRIVTENGDKLEFSSYHPVLTTVGYVCVKDLTTAHHLIRANLCKSNMETLNGQENHQGTTNLRLESTLKEEKIGYTNSFTKKYTGKFLKGMRCITEITIRRITHLAILYYSQQLNILLNIEKVNKSQVENLQSMLKKTSVKYSDLQNLASKVSTQEKIKVENLILLEKSTGLVCSAKRFLNCIKNPVKTLNSVLLYALVDGIKLIPSALKPAHTAGKSFNNVQELKKCVAQNVLKELKLKHLLDLFQDSALSVDVRSKEIQKQLLAEKNAKELEKLDWKKKEFYGRVKVHKIYKIGFHPTYNFEVEDTHNYSVQNGYVVHNCIDCISQLGSLTPWKPSAEVSKKYNKGSGIWEDDFDEPENAAIESYIV